MLSVVPGISALMARSPLGSFGSLAAVADAAPDGLRRHPGIGQVRADRLAAALHGSYVALADRKPEPERAAPGVRAVRRWVLSGPSVPSGDGDADGELESYSRKAIALRALRGAAGGTQLVDSLTGEVVAEARPGSG